MKKLLFASLFLLISLVATGQGQVGIVGGYTSARMSLSEEISSIDIKSAPGYTLGVAGYFPLAVGFSVQPQIMYSSKQAEVVGLSKHKVEYVEVPVQLQWGIDLIVIKPYVFVEPFAGLAVSGNVRNLQSSAKTRLKLDKRLEYGYSLGAGLMIGRHVQLSFKYFRNLDSAGLDVNVIPGANLSSEEKSFNGLALSAGVFF